MLISLVLHQFFSIVQEALTEAELSDYVDCDSKQTDERVTLFGLDKAQLFEKSPHFQVCCCTFSFSTVILSCVLFHCELFVPI